MENFLSILHKYFSVQIANPYAGKLVGDGTITVITQTLIVGGFFLAAYLIIRYLKKFYGDRPIPQEWHLFWLAVVWGSIHELWEMATIYKWVSGLAVKPIFLVIQIIAGFYLIAGSYLLAKKGIIK